MRFVFVACDSGKIERACNIIIISTRYIAFLLHVFAVAAIFHTRNRYVSRNETETDSIDDEHANEQ
jgi:hypothetical protein